MTETTLTETDTLTELTLDQQIVAATRAYIAARRYGTAEEIIAAYTELERLLALRDG